MLSLWGHASLMAGEAHVRHMGVEPGFFDLRPTFSVEEVLFFLESPQALQRMENVFPKEKM